MTLANRTQEGFELPGIASAHSHAFQRALRACTQRGDKTGSFWSWRDLMYEHVATLTPESIYEVSKLAYKELAMHGVSAVGEFHYVHHQADGTPYEDRTLLAQAVVRAARDVGLRICLLRVVYERAGHQQSLEAPQRRFVDSRISDALADVDALRRRYEGDPCITVGVAPHSVRAVTSDWIREAHRFARERKLPFHMHVAEQAREIEECLGEHGKRPVEFLDALGVLDPRFVAVHATHLQPHEAQLLGRAQAFTCLCRSTERDLGDGLPNIAMLRDAGTRFCVGADSHAWSCPFEEARAIEWDERSRTEQRIAGLDAPALLRALTKDGYASLGFAEATDRVVLDPSDISMQGCANAPDEDRIIYSASRGAVRSVSVEGNTLVSRA